MPNRLTIIIVLISLATVASLSAPLWGGCGYNERLCSGWCEVRHVNAELQQAACRAACAADKLSCLMK